MNHNYITKTQIFFLCVFLLGCIDNKSGATTIPVVVVTETKTSTIATPTDIPVDVVVLPSDFDHLIELHSGQTFAIEPPSSDEKWQVEHDPDLFAPLTPQKDMQFPGTTGWLFKAIASGDGQIVLTSIADCANPPCPLMPVRFQINFRVR